MRVLRNASEANSMKIRLCFFVWRKKKNFCLSEITSVAWLKQPLPSRHTNHSNKIIISKFLHLSVCLSVESQSGGKNKIHILQAGEVKAAHQRWWGIVSLLQMKKHCCSDMCSVYLQNGLKYHTKQSMYMWCSWVVTAVLGNLVWCS